jgi:SAM-dependent methyltransferase/uncharacterized protein YbaR (Trm112 family)
MKLSVLPLLACPAPRERGACGGALAPAPFHRLKLRHAEGDPEELRDGGLLCRTCGAGYPVLSGVAILVAKPEEYLRRYHRSLLRDLDRHGAMPVETRSWLVRRYSGARDQQDYGADFRYSQQFEEAADIARAMVPDAGALYGGFVEWLERVAGAGPYEVLGGWARELLRGPQLLLDAGCGCGGLLSRVGPLARAAFGVDFSFLAVLLARRALLRLPEAERTYRLVTRRGEWVERPLNLPHLTGGEIVVADAAALPFPPGLFDAVCSSNVVDIAGIDGPLDAAAAALRPGGTLLFTDPFYFRDGEAPPGDPRAAIDAAIERRGLRVERRQDGVPWVWSTYDRHWRLYFSYCLAARKAGT